MRSTNFQLPIAVLAMVLALSGCGRKPEAQAEASKSEQPLGMHEAPTPTTPTADSASLVPGPQAEGNTDVNAVLPPAGTNSNAGVAVAAQNPQQLPGVANTQSSALPQTTQAAATDSAERAAMRTRLKKGPKSAAEVQE